MSNIPVIDFTGMVFVDKDGRLTTQASGVLNQLLDTLNSNIGTEGLVSPSQSSANITTIQNNQNQKGQYTCAFGTLLYDSDNNLLKVALSNSGAPLFKTITTV
ncbi:MAG: hypothetical protein ACYC6W_11060 [Nitrosotalea sp.]